MPSTYHFTLADGGSLVCTWAQPAHEQIAEALEAEFGPGVRV